MSGESATSWQMPSDTRACSSARNTWIMLRADLSAASISLAPAAQELRHRCQEPVVPRVIEQRIEMGHGVIGDIDGVCYFRVGDDPLGRFHDRAVGDSCC